MEDFPLNFQQKSTFQNLFYWKLCHFDENLRISKDFSNFGDWISDYNQFIMLNEVPVRYHFSWIYTLSGFTVIIHRASIMEASLYIPTWNLNSNFQKIQVQEFLENSAMTSLKGIREVGKLSWKVELKSFNLESSIGNWKEWSWKAQAEVGKYNWSWKVTYEVGTF